MKNLLAAWIGQSTTGQGFAVLAASAAASHGISASMLVSFLIGGVILVLWPQKAAILTPDVEKLISAAAPVIKDLLSSGSVAVSVDATATGGSAVGTMTQIGAGGPGRAAVGMVLALMVMSTLAACGANTAQQAAYAATGAYSVAAGLEVQALQSPTLSQGDKDNIKTLDNSAYAALVIVDKDVVSGTIPMTDVLTLTADTQALVAFLNSKGFKL